MGGMRAGKILIATPLLQWYLRQGLQVTRIYQVVEYVPMRCFRKFVRDVSAARRLGDTVPSMSVLADTQKLIGNCGHGGQIMDQSKHRHVTCVQGANAASQEANNPPLMAVTELQDEVYEVEMAKKIIFDLPIQLGYFILQYAKLRMLQFYYDFLDSHVNRKDFQYCEMETDSAYMSISGSSLEDVIRPEMLVSYRIDSTLIAVTWILRLMTSFTGFLDNVVKITKNTTKEPLGFSNLSLRVTKW